MDVPNTQLFRTSISSIPVMRILLVNKFYYRRGGDCVVTINTADLLQRHGHEVGIFTMDYPDNIDTGITVGTASQTDFAGSMPQKLRATWRALGHGDIISSFSKAMDSFRPDVVHLHNIHSYLSPVIAEIAHHRGIRVVWTLHDYKLICPAYSCLDPDGHVCEECFTDTAAVLRRRCHKGSLAASAIAWLEARTWNRLRLQSAVDTFICPSRFMMDKMASAGFDRRQLTHLCNFDPATHTDVNTVRTKGYALYAGRLSREKGVDTLLSTASGMPGLQLTVAGDGPLGDELRQTYATAENVTFTGHVDGKRVKELMSQAAFTIIPSEWYENNPLGVIESLNAGTPVIGADIGGIPELIDEHSGIIFTSGDTGSLKSALEKAMARDWDHTAIAHDAHDRFSADTHYDRLMQIYHRAD